MNKSKTLFLSSVAAVALTAGTTTAMADVTMTSTVTKDKDVTITLLIQKQKRVDIRVDFDRELVSAAEAHALANIENSGNTVGRAELSTIGEPDEETLGGDPYGIQVDALIEDSINDNTGVISVNQDAGNVVNQSNILAVAAINPGNNPEQAFTDSQAVVDQVNTNNEVTQIEDIAVDENGDPILTPDKTAHITGSVNNNAGVISVNQNAGNMNNQTNAVALSVGFGATLALSDAHLGQVNSGNHVHEFETIKHGLIQGSVNDNSGIVSGNQSTGNMNNQANSIAFSALTTTAVVGVPGS